MNSFALVTLPQLDTDVLLKREQFAVSLRKKQRSKKLDLRRKKNYEKLADNLLTIGSTELKAQTRKDCL